MARAELGVVAPHHHRLPEGDEHTLIFRGILRDWTLLFVWIGWIPGGLEFAIAVRNRVKPSGIRALRYVGSY